MSDLHRNSRFLRFLRSICSKTACARRAIVALFVAVATILATFMIMPSASMGASQQGEPKQAQTQSENVDPKAAQDVNTAESKADAKGGASASGENGESKSADLRAVESVNPRQSTNPDVSNADHAQNVDSEKKQNPAVGDKKDAKDAAERAKKEESANKSNRQEREAHDDDRAAAGKDLPKECKKADSLAKCYKVKYEPKFSEKKEDRDKISVRGKKFSVEPTFKLGTKTAKEFKKDFVTKFELEKLESLANNKKIEVKNNGLVTVDDKTGKITVYANKWEKDAKYYAYVKVTYSDGSYTTSLTCPTGNTKCVKNTVRLSFSVARIEVAKGDLSLKVYDNKDSTTGKEVKDNGTAATVESDKDGKFSSIEKPIFIDTKSANKPNPIYHRMICHKDGNSSDYHLNSINGLTLSDSADGGNKVPTQKQWNPALGNRPTVESADDESSTPKVYENDPFAERSQSWIVGTPKDVGDFTCKVFAFNDADFYPMKTSVGSYVKLFKSNTSDDNSKLQSIFEKPWKAFYTAGGGEGQNVSEEKYEDSLSKQKTIDWDYKTIKIVVKSNKKQKLEVKDGDLKLNVYPFKNIDGSLPTALSDNNNKISAMLGMELKPFVDATSAADSTKKITLRVLCSKGEKKNVAAGGASSGGTGSAGSGSAGSGSSGDTSGTGSTGANTGTGSQINKPSESSQSAEATWSSKPDGLVLSVPEDTKQTRCNKANDWDKECTAKNVASQASMEVSIKPTDVGNYQCVVFALKNDALTEFESVIKNTKSDSLTPDSIKSELTNVTKASPTVFKENKDFAAFTFNIDSVSNFTLPHTGEWNWNLQLGAIAAVMVSVLAAGFVASQSDSYRKLFYERRRC